MNKEDQFTQTIKNCFNDTLMPAMQEQVRVEVAKAMARERDYYWQQFCETKFQSIITNLQRTIATLLVVKDDLK